MSNRQKLKSSKKKRFIQIQKAINNFNINYHPIPSDEIFCDSVNTDMHDYYRQESLGATISHNHVHFCSLMLMHCAFPYIKVDYPKISSKVCRKSGGDCDYCPYLCYGILDNNNKLIMAAGATYKELEERIKGRELKL